MGALHDVITRLERQREAIDRALAALREADEGTGAQAPREADGGQARTEAARAMAGTT